MRSFTIVDFPKKGETYGRYISKYPKNAAKKAFTKLSSMIDLKNSNRKKFLIFTIKETTKNSNKNMYKYIGTRIKLYEPIIIEKNGKNIVYKYKNIITSHKNFIK
jgi:hypothetical protein